MTLVYLFFSFYFIIGGVLAGIELGRKGTDSIYYYNEPIKDKIIFTLLLIIFSPTLFVIGKIYFKLKK